MTVRPRDVEEWERQPEHRTWPGVFFWGVIVICMAALSWHVSNLLKRPSASIQMGHVVQENWNGVCVVVDPKRHYVRPAWENIVCTPENAKKQGWY